MAKKKKIQKKPSKSKGANTKARKASSSGHQAAPETEAPGASGEKPPKVAGQAGLSDEGGSVSGTQGRAKQKKDGGKKGRGGKGAKNADQAAAKAESAIAEPPLTQAKSDKSARRKTKSGNGKPAAKPAGKAQSKSKQHPEDEELPSASGQSKTEAAGAAAKSGKKTRKKLSKKPDASTPPEKGGSEETAHEENPAPKGRKKRLRQASTDETGAKSEEAVSFVDSPFAETAEELSQAQADATASSGEEAPPLGSSGEENELSEEEENRRFLKGLLEALLFASDKPLTLRELARAAKLDRPRTRELLKEVLQDHQHSGIALIEIAGGFSFRSHPAYATYVQKMLAMRPVRLSRAQLETLAVIAYRQPATRPEVDDIRGVDTGQVIKGLMERDLIKILGKKDEPGRPMLYGTTDAFLELFSLESLKELPSLREFTELNETSRATFENEIGETAPEGPVEDASGEEASEVDGAQPSGAGDGTAAGETRTDSAASDEPAKDGAGDGGEEEPKIDEAALADEAAVPEESAVAQRSALSPEEQTEDGSAPGHLPETPEHADLVGSEDDEDDEDDED